MKDFRTELEKSSLYSTFFVQNSLVEKYMFIFAS